MTVTSARTTEIRQVAAALFEQRGYSATTMTHIANAVGVFPGSLYHHFESKEEIAVEILRALDRDLDRLATSLARNDADAPPEGRLCHLTSEVMALSARNAAAVRLRAYDAPTVATERLHRALEPHAPALERAWKETVKAVAAGSTDPGDAGLLRFAFRTLAMEASVQYPPGADPALHARHLCDALLHGVVTTLPEDDELDRSEAMAAADDATTSWHAVAPPADVREQIISAARTEFARRGYEATTIRDVADAAGVRMGTLYRRVESKDAILREVIESYAGSLDKAFRAVLTSGSSEAASLDALARVFVRAKRRFREESEILKFGWSGRERESSPFHEYFLQTQERLRLLEDFLARGMRRRTVRRFATPAELAPHIRLVLWLPYQDFARTSEERAHRFLRRTLLRGFLTS